MKIFWIFCKQMFAFCEKMCYYTYGNRKFVRKGDFMEPINETQKRIYEFLVERSQDGVPPSVREIGAAVGLKSTSSVQAHLDVLEAEGYTKFEKIYE